ncbi:hypothetical protein INS49_011984 [Diaporthe citri]|uniref:uncharacterized protein n=1 Tax=Diaporthe citri TaxID=83186 RepID=UPI001C80BCCF|nr:uncharacterized protein INS49_011984 [Diaporthe citri]KAG6360916.1 hypothetical protein INS49_011984 [Diaporthe citri]
MAPARNTRGKSARMDKEVSVTSKEATAVTFAAAALTHMSENPDLYPAEWTTGAKTNKAAILTMANKVNQIGEGTTEPESPAEVLRRLQLDSATPSRKRKMTISLLGDEEEDQRVYKSANIFANKNPFASPAKKTAEATRSEKADPAAIATLLENKEYFQNVATFMGNFGDIANLTFDAHCPAMENLREGRPIGSDATLAVGQEHIHVVFVYDRFTTGGLFPSAFLDGLVKAMHELRIADPDNLTDKVPVSFILHAMLRMNRDFGVVKLRYDNNSLNKNATIAAWKAKYSGNLAPECRETMCRRIAGLVDYVKNHGVIKCHALTEREVDLVIDGLADDTVDAFWGAGASQGHGRNAAADID